MLFPMVSSAEVFWKTTWDEDPAEIAAYPGGWWDTSCGASWPETSNPGTSNLRAFSGTKSLKHHFFGHQPYAGGCFADRWYPAVDEVWFTYWEWMDDGFQVDSPGTKALKPGDNRGSHWWGYMWNSRFLSFTCQSCKDAAEGEWGSENYYQNMTSFAMPDATWVCYELHLKYNTPGQKNAVYEGFATPYGGQTVQFAGYYNREWRGTSTSDPLPSNTQFAMMREYVQDGIGELYRDDHTVSTTRVGCGNGVPPPPPPPVCGDGICNGSETSGSCSADCAPSGPVCGDGVCNGGETTNSCAADCAAPGPSCGDANCDASESCSSCVADCGSCPVSGNPATVTDLASVANEASSVTLEFTEVDDGTGQPARYEVRYASPNMSWGSANVASGSCAAPLVGAQVGQTISCSVTGLVADTDYQFQLVSFRGTLNQDAVFGGLSNVASATTTSVAIPPGGDSDPVAGGDFGPVPSGDADSNGQGSANVQCHDENGTRVCDIDATTTISGCVSAPTHWLISLLLGGCVIRRRAKKVS